MNRPLTCSPFSAPSSSIVIPSGRRGPIAPLELRLAFPSPRCLPPRPRSVRGGSSEVLATHWRPPLEVCQRRLSRPQAAELDEQVVGLQLVQRAELVDRDPLGPA